jgi:hypothetical protein
VTCCVELPAGSLFFGFAAVTCSFTMFCTYMTFVRVTQLRATLKSSRTQHILSLVYAHSPTLFMIDY